MFRTQKMLAIFLSVVLFLGAFSVATPVFAENVTDAIEHYEFVQNAINNPAAAEQTTPEAEITFEVEEKRDEYTKVYKKDDGTYTAVMSAEPLHYLKDGEWEEINNSLLPNGDTYSNAENSFTVEVPENINSNENLTVEKDGYEISFSVEGISESSAVVENNIVTSETQVPLADEAITQTQSSVTYSDIAENTALQYVVTPNSIKENIIVSNKESVKETYTFTFETNGLNVDKQDDGSVEFKSESGDVKFRIPRPVMTDSAQAFSYDIAVVLVYNTDGTVTLKYSPSQEWVNNTERVYPINIDPAIEVGDKDSTWVEDTYVLEDSQIDTSGDKYYNAAIGGVVNVIEENGRTRYSEVYTKLNMEKAKVLGDNVIFTEVQYLFLGYTTNGYAVAKEIKEDIDFKEVKGAQRLQLESEAIDYYTSPFTGYEGLPSTYMHFNITKPFNDWYRGEPNNGFAVVPGNEGFYSAVVLNGTSTSYYLNQMNRPYATIIVMDYVDMGGYNPKYTYDEKYVGRAGKSYVNLLTQQLTVIRDDFSILGENEFTLGMMFDSATSKKLQELGHTSVLAYGNNWIPNYLRAYLIVNDSYVNYYTQTGSVVEFLCSTNSDDNKIYTEQLYGAEKGGGYEFDYHPAIDGETEYYTVTRPDGHIEKFNSFGLLVSETVSEDPEQKINIQYDNKLRIDRVTDIYGGTYSYAYEDKGLVSTVTYTSANQEYTKTIYYEHDRYNNLTRIEAVDENNRIYVCGYEYDANGNMSEIIYGAVGEDEVVVDDIGLRYTYDDSGRVVAATELTYNGEGFVGGGATTYERLNTTQVEVTDAQNNYKVYSFDIKGKHLYTYDSATGAIIFEERQSENVVPSIYNYSENYKMNDWQSSSDFVRSEENNEPIFEIQGGVEDETVLYQIVNIIGCKNNEITISGCFEGLFTKSETSNKWLLGEKEGEEMPSVNFTNDRFAQIEVSYVYEELDDEGNIIELKEKIVFQFSQNVFESQYFANRIELKGNTQQLLVCIRYAKNANPAKISCFELVEKYNNKLNYENELTKEKIISMTTGPKKNIAYTYNGSKISSLIYYDELNNETKIEYVYRKDDVNKTDFLSEILINGELQHEVNKNSCEVISKDEEIIRYINTDVGTLGCIDSDFYSIEQLTGTEEGVIAFQETVNNKTYFIKMEGITYNYLNGVAKTTSNFYNGYKNKDGIVLEGGIGVESVQDWYGRRESNTATIQQKNTEGIYFDVVKVFSEYGYEQNNNDFDTLNSVKTYTNTISIPSQTSDAPESYSLAYEYGENTVEEYAYYSKNSMELRYSYEYDELNRLVRFNDNVSNPKYSYVYEYDGNGNILSESVYSYVPLGTSFDNATPIEYYEYDYSGNILTAYEGEDINQDINGNPTAINGADLVWEGARLSSYTYTDEAGAEKRILYTYDEEGYISSKTVQKKLISSDDEQSEIQYEDIEKYQYTWAYGKVINQVHTSYENGVEIKTVIKFVYDSYNSVQGFIVNDTASYIYLKNLQGDIIGVVNEAGEVVASYSYDVWGKQTVTTTQNIVGLLPLAYRGYFFDNYANLYFIDKRAYNPEWGKFLDSASAEAEGLPEIAEYNMYTYWENNPVWYMTEEEKEAYEANSVANYWHNKKVTVENFAKLKEQQGVEDDNQVNTFIYDQTLDEINQYRCGVVTSRPKGCGWIATYNASKLLGYNFKPECVIWEYEKMGIFMQGFFGVHPFAVARFFTKRGHDIDVHFGDFVDLDNLNSLSEVNVMFYDGKPTGHYAAIQYKNNVFEGYNVFGSTAVEPLGNSIYDPGKAEDNTLGVYTGKVLISISPKE